MTLYDDLQGIATELLTEFNQGGIALIRVTPGTGPANNPGPSVQQPPIPLNAVARGVKHKYVVGGLAVASDLQVTHSVLDIPPTMRDYIQIGGERYKITQIIPKPAAGTVAAYTLIVSKG